MPKEELKIGDYISFFDNNGKIKEGQICDIYRPTYGLVSYGVKIERKVHSNAGDFVTYAYHRVHEKNILEVKENGVHDWRLCNF